MLDIDDPDDYGLLAYLVRTECHICLELRLAGVEVSPELDDDTWGLSLDFKTAADLDRFLTMVDFDTMPNRDRWEASRDGARWVRFRTGRGFQILGIPRSDLGIAHGRLKVHNARTIEGYEQKKRDEIDRTGYTDA